MNVTLVLCDIDADRDNAVPRKSVELGSYEYVNFYLTAVCRFLESNQWGKRFPILMESLDSGTKIEPDDCEEFLAELNEVKEELKNINVSDLGNVFEKKEIIDTSADVLAETLYEYFITLDEDNLTQIIYDFAVEAGEENMSLMYIFD